MTKQLQAVSAILLSVLIFLVGAGLLNTIIPVRAHLEGFSNFTIGLIGSAYYAGFVAGCYVGPRLLARVGHSRTFAVAAGLATASTLALSLVMTEFSWIVLRGLFGVGAACLYMVAESWLNDRATNETRGRVFASYMVVNYLGIVLGQWLFVTARPASFSLFSIAAIAYAVCLIPIGLTRTQQPSHTEVPTLNPLKIFRASPVGVAGCIAVGFANAAVWTFAPIYAWRRGGPGSGGPSVGPYGSPIRHCRCNASGGHWRRLPLFLRRAQSLADARPDRAFRDVIAAALRSVRGAYQ
jgi:MFS family permease